ISADDGRGGVATQSFKIAVAPARENAAPLIATTPETEIGAGDAFASTVVAALAEGTAPGEALRAGACNAASVVGAADTQTGLLDRDTLRMRLAETKERFAVTHFSV
ncbi:MAG: hypothetical protein AAFQ42_10705, partial [Pseudomonadota bacterium]